MNRRKFVKGLAVIATVGLALYRFWIMSSAAILGRHPVSAGILPVGIQQTLLEAPQINWPVWIILYFALTLYFLYSWDVIGRQKSEYARQYVIIADVGFLFVALLGILALNCLDQGLLGLVLLFRLAAILVLIRVAMGYKGRRSQPYWGRVPGDLTLGIGLYWTGVDLLRALMPLSMFQGVVGQSFLTVVVEGLMVLATMICARQLLIPFAVAGQLGAFGLVAMAHLTPQGWAGQFPIVYIGTLMGMVVLLVTLVVVLVKKNQSK